jgi:hypothetical protein
MPPQDRFRFHHLGQIEQPGPNPGHPDQQCPVAAVQSRLRWRPPQGDIELIAEKQVFSFKPASRLEHIGDEHAERVQDRNHQSKCCNDSASRRESTPDDIFGKDSVDGRQRTRTFSALLGQRRDHAWRYRAVSLALVQHGPMKRGHP